jgi:hypothetical protein
MRVIHMVSFRVENSARVLSRQFKSAHGDEGVIKRYKRTSLLISFVPALVFYKRVLCLLCLLANVKAEINKNNC